MSRISPCCGETMSPIVTVMFFLCQSPLQRRDQISRALVLDNPQTMP
jgi:hypothetical protein